jgi:nucleoside-triphosphatase THEP1
MITILSGSSGSGKTTLLEALINRLEAKGQPLDGFLSPGVFNGECAKQRINVRILPKGRELLLATPRSSSSLDDNDDKLAWEFNDEAIDVVNDHIDALNERFSQEYGRDDGKHQYLVFDEIGPLELKHGKGFMAALRLCKAFSASVYVRALVVVRPELIESFKGYLDPYYRGKPDRIKVFDLDRKSYNDKQLYNALTGERVNPLSVAFDTLF